MAEKAQNGWLRTVKTWIKGIDLGSKTGWKWNQEGPKWAIKKGQKGETRVGQNRMKKGSKVGVTKWSSKGTSKRWVKKGQTWWNRSKGESKRGLKNGVSNWSKKGKNRVKKHASKQEVKRRGLKRELITGVRMVLWCKFIKRGSITGRKRGSKSWKIGYFYNYGHYFNSAGSEIAKRMKIT